MPSPRDPGIRVETVPRAVFLTPGKRWRYKPGEHVSFLGPTGYGKTTFAFQLLDITATPKLPAVVLAMKPRDDTVTKFAKRAGFRTVRTWPPPPSIFQPRRTPGWVVWPPHTFNEDVDDRVHEEVFGRSLRMNYQRGDRIVFADEAYGLSHELGLEKALVRIWTRGRSMGCGLWAATQKPTHVPLWMYSQAEHLFLSHDPDKRARLRFTEIGGVDPDLVASVVARLQKYHWLYIRRSDQTMCVVGP